MYEGGEISVSTTGMPLHREHVLRTNKPKYAAEETNKSKRNIAHRTREIFCHHEFNHYNCYVYVALYMIVGHSFAALNVIDLRSWINFPALVN